MRHRIALLIGFALAANAHAQTRIDVGTRWAGMFAYDSLRDRLVLYGGNFSRAQGAPDIGDPDPKTYLFNGTSWTLLASNGPRTRDEVAYAYDPRNASILMFGGRGEGTERDAMGMRVRIPFRETWRLSDTTWTRVDSGGPLGFSGPQGAFDVARGRFVVFGGRIARDTFPASTWEWDGTRWHRFDVPGPIGRAGHVMAYDAKSKRVILHGGVNNSVALRDTWSWDGTAWRRLSADGPKTLFGAASTALDSGIVLFGGHTMDGASNVVFHWTGTKWDSVATPASGPAARTFNMMTVDTRRKRIYMFGGSIEGDQSRNPPAELWYLDASYKWIRVVTR